MASFANKHIYRSKLTHHISVLSILLKSNYMQYPLKEALINVLNAVDMHVFMSR